MKANLLLVFALIISMQYACKKTKNEEVVPSKTDTVKTGTPVTTTPVVVTAKGNVVTKFSVKVNDKIVAGLIDTNSNTVYFNLPANPGIDPGLMRPYFQISSKATITPDSIAIQDFINPVKYTITSEAKIPRVFTIKAIQQTLLTPVAPKPFIVYNGIPTLVNGSTTIDQAARFFTQFRIVVFGNHLNDPTSIWRNPTSQLIFAMRAIDPTVKVYGYIPMGIIERLSSAQLRTSADNWYSMGANGIFLDEYDYDFNNTRERQNDIVDYIHSRTLSVFVNSYKVDDALADYNGSPTHLNSGDIELLENLLVKQGAVTPLSEFYLRANKAYTYMRTKGISIASLSTIPLANLSATSNNSDLFKFAWCGAAMYNFTYFQFTDSNYSTTSNAFFYSGLTGSLGASFTPQYDWIKPNGANEYYRSTDKVTIHVYSNGTGSITNN